MKKKLYVYGAGGHAKVVANAALLTGYDICGFVEDGTARLGAIWNGAPIICRDQLPPLSAVIIAFGDCRRRLALGLELQSEGFALPSIIHPSAQIGHGVELGSGCFIGALSNIDPGCVIGALVIVNNQANICHDSVIGDGCHLCPSTILAGNVCVGSRSWIGIGSVVKEKIVIGSDVMVGAGSVVIRDIKDCVKCYGNPAHKNILKID